MWRPPGRHHHPSAPQYLNLIGRHPSTPVGGIKAKKLFVAADPLCSTILLDPTNGPTNDLLPSLCLCLFANKARNVPIPHLHIVTAPGLCLVSKASKLQIRAPQFEGIGDCIDVTFEDISTHCQHSLPLSSRSVLRLSESEASDLRPQAPFQVCELRGSESALQGLQLKSPEIGALPC